MATFVDGIPVLFGLEDDDDDDPSVEPWLAPLGARVAVERWEGEYPLRGHLLIQSLSMLEHEVAPLLPPDMR